MNEIIVIGGGLAGVEAAWQAARAGARVRLHEMRPVKQTPAHRTDKLAEIVCSNSLKSDEEGSASHLLKEELRRGHSLFRSPQRRSTAPTPKTSHAACLIEVSNEAASSRSSQASVPPGPPMSGGQDTLP